MNLYALYLAGDLLTKRLAAVDLTPMYILQGRDHADTEGGRGFRVDLKIDYRDASGKWMSPEDRERCAGEFALRYPDAEMVRKNADYGGRPELSFRGVTSLGVAWSIEFGETACERVQVGTKTVERVDPEAFAALPKVTVDEPVYEYRCTDPIAAAVSV